MTRPQRGEHLVLQAVGEVRGVEQGHGDRSQRVASLGVLQALAGQRGTELRIEDGLAFLLQPPAQSRNLRGAAHGIRTFDDDQFAAQRRDIHAAQRLAIKLQRLSRWHRFLGGFLGGFHGDFLGGLLLARCATRRFSRPRPSSPPPSAGYAAVALPSTALRRWRGIPSPQPWLRTPPECGPEECGSSRPYYDRACRWPRRAERESRASGWGAARNYKDCAPYGGRRHGPSRAQTRYMRSHRRIPPHRL